MRLRYRPVTGGVGNLAACDHGVVPVSLVVTADTHVPKRSRDLPHGLWAAIEAADVVVHAGDWVDVALLDEIEGRSRLADRRKAAAARPLRRGGGRGRSAGGRRLPRRPPGGGGGRPPLDARAV